MLIVGERGGKKATESLPLKAKEIKGVTTFRPLIFILGY